MNSVPPESARDHSWRAVLGLNRSTGALLAAILLIGMGQELWAPFMPTFIQANLKQYFATHAERWNLAPATIVILLIGLFGTWKDLQEAVYYYLGGRIGGTLGTRRALIIFATLPLIGYAMLLCAFTPAIATIMAFAALPFIAAYDSISQPAALTVVGKTLESRHRTMAFSLQSIQRRISRIAAYLTAGFLVYAFGAIAGVKVGVAISIVLVLLAVFIQVAMLKSDTRDKAVGSHGFHLSLIRRFPPELRRLLLADILARVAEGLPRELFVIYAVLGTTESALVPSAGTFGIDARTFGILLAVQSLTSLLIYIPIGWLASKPGASKKPFINLTFLFFALFPLAFLLLGTRFGVVGLFIAYIVAGLREIGEPTRKAMITELLPADARTAATGLYWSIRTLAVMLAPLLGAIIWLTISPAAVFITAAAAGIIGAIFFAAFFRPSAPGSAGG